MGCCLPGCCETPISPNIITILAVCSVTLTFVISYPIAIGEDHMKSPAYYLSSSIAYAPERMVGSFFLGIAMMLMMGVAYMRYRLIKLELPDYVISNCWTFWLCVVCNVCIHGVGSFPFTDSLTLHLISADTAFFGYNIYLIAQTWYLDPALIRRNPNYMRGACCCCRNAPTCCQLWTRRVMSFIGPICIVILCFTGNPTNDGPRKKLGDWDPSDSLLGPIAEILLVFSFQVWLLTLINSWDGLGFYDFCGGIESLEDRDTDSESYFDDDTTDGPRPGGPVMKPSPDGPTGQVYGVQMQPYPNGGAQLQPNLNGASQPFPNGAAQMQPTFSPYPNGSVL